MKIAGTYRLPGAPEQVWELLNDPERLAKCLPGCERFVKGEGKLELTEKQGQTEVRYTGEAQIGGMIAAIGQRMIEGAARKMIQQFFESAAAQLQTPARKAGGGR